MAIAFDGNRVEVKGSPVPVLDGVQGFTTSPFFPYLGISDSGTLAYIPGAGVGAGTQALVWVDRKGVEQPLPAPRRDYYRPMLSPDGLSIAVGVRSQGIWLYDLVRGTLHKVTSEGDSETIIWTPDGKRLVYSIGSGSSISWIAADGSGPPSILTRVEKNRIYANSVSPDG
jgi:Tol biopolymer transport system component